MTDPTLGELFLWSCWRVSSTSNRLWVFSVPLFSTQLSCFFSLVWFIKYYFVLNITQDTSMTGSRVLWVWELLCIVVTFLVVVTEGIFREERFIFACSFKGWIVMVWKVWHQELETDGHIVSTFGKQRRLNGSALYLRFFFPLQDSVNGMSWNLHSAWAFPPQLHSYGNPHRQTSFIGDFQMLSRWQSK